MLFPVGGGGGIDVAGFLVENFLRVAIFADRAIDSLPDIELFAGAAVGAEGEFVLIDDAGGG